MFEFKLPEEYNAATTFVDENLERGLGEKTAIYHLDERISYRQVYENVNRAGSAFRGLGVEMEQRIALLLPDSPEFVYSFFGAIRIGAVAVPLGTMLAADDYRFMLNDSRARLLVAHESLAPEIDRIRKDLKYLRAAIVVGGRRPGWLDFNELLVAGSAALEPAETSKDDMAFWLYTSGSTGRPKAAVHLQHDMIYCADTVGRYVFGITENDITFSVSKLYFAYGLGCGLYFAFRVGASTVLYPERPAPEKIFEVITRYRPTVVATVPTIYARLLQVENAESYDLSSVRLFTSSGEILPPAIFYRWRERFGHELLDVVGSTENLHDFLANRPGLVKPGSSGLEIPGYELKIVDDRGEELPAGQVGHLLVKGDSASPFYWNRHDASKKTMLGEWLRTGDMYYRDQDGYYWYCGRSDDMIKVGGLWVSPVEVENIILEHPAVLEAAVVGAEGEDGLIKPKAYVALKPGTAEVEAVRREIERMLEARLPSYKVPRSFEFVAELPKTPTGKVQRFKLRAATGERS